MAALAQTLRSPGSNAAYSPRGAASARPQPPRGGGAGGQSMELKKFLAPTMAECLTQVKSQLGTQAIILSTRTIAHKRFFGLLRREHVEITAGRGIQTLARRRALASSLGPDSAATSAPRNWQPESPADQMPGRGLLNTPAGASAAYLGVTQEIGDLKRMVAQLVQQFQHSQHPDVPSHLVATFRQLLAQQVTEPLAREIVFKLAERAAKEGEADKQSLQKMAVTELESRLVCGGRIRKTANGRPHIVALIGPTGVGKTTTVAKLAANLKLRENHKVGLITIDTYRIAAIDQLKKYAEIINAPLAVVASPAEIRDAVARMGDLDFVLIDTAGRSPKDAVKLAELKQFLAAASPDEVHLVLSSTCGLESTKLALRRFSGVRTDRLIFTKLDEAAELGVLPNVTSITRLPLSYVTTGQDVPNDIETASGTKLARQILTAAPPDAPEPDEQCAAA